MEGYNYDLLNLNLFEFNDLSTHKLQDTKLSKWTRSPLQVSTLRSVEISPSFFPLFARIIIDGCGQWISIWNLHPGNYSLATAFKIILRWGAAQQMVYFEDL